MSAPFVRQRGRWLEVDFGVPFRTLSWALIGGGYGEHRRVVWHYVRRAELPLGRDPRALLADRLEAAGFAEAVGLLTARELGPYAHARRRGGVHAGCVATVGLGNALRAGDPAAEAPTVGTINLAVWVDQPLSDAALLEALALAVEARTAALLERGVPSQVSGLPATGTGTDCAVVAAPRGEGGAAYAGKHTQVGCAVGDVVMRAVGEAADGWLSEQGRDP